MKTEHRVIVGAVIFGLLVWVVDAVVDYFFFLEGAFGDVLILNVPTVKLYMRAFMLSCFLVFGIIISRMLVKKVQAEEELKASEKKYRSLIENANDAIISTDEEGTIISFNKKAEKLFGYSRDEVLGKSVASITHPSRKKMQEKHLEKIQTLHDLSGKIREGKVLGKNGQEFPVEVVTYAIGLNDEYIYTSIMRDISERKKAEMEIKKAKDFLENVIESSRDAIVITDVKGTILSVNGAGERLYGSSKDDLLGKHASSLTTLDNSTKEKARENLEELYEKGFISVEGKHITKDGKYIDVEANRSLIVDSEGNNFGGVSIIRDVTERKKFEQTLKRSEEKYHSLIENANDAVMSLNEEGSLLEFNKKAEEMFGYSRSEVVGKSVLLLTTPSEKEKSIKEFERFKGIRQLDVAGKTIERNLLRKDGSVFIGECSTFGTEFQGKYIFTTFIRDITERRKEQEELKKTKEHLDNVIESSLDSIIITDKQGYVRRASKSFLNLLGYTEADQVIGKHIAEFSPLEVGTYESVVGEFVKLDEEFFDKVRTVMANFVEKGRIVNFEFYLIRNDKKVINVEENIVNLYNEEGERIGAVGVIRDISERKMVEKEIRKSRDFLESIIEGSRDGIAIVDEMGCITSANTSMEKMCRFSKEELIGKHASELTIDDKDMRKDILKKMGELFKRGYVFCEAKHETKGGNIIEVEYSLSMIKNEKGDYIAGVSIIRDISERKEMQDKLLQSEKLKSLGELAGGVAHDFNNVLAAILGRAQLLKLLIEPPQGRAEKRKSMFELKKGLEVIERASIDGAETVRRIQEFALRRNDEKYHSATNLNKVLEDALDFTRPKWKDDPETKGIEFRIQKELSPIPLITGNASELREVFTNLINNALDAMPQGGAIKVKTYRKDDHIFIKVEDTGDGIPGTVRERVFDPFFTTKGVHSSGLGLSVSYGIINRHRGTITIDSVEGERTAFTVKLPVANGVVEEEAIEAVKIEQRKAKILVIEDEEQVCDLLSDILFNGGHEVETAASGSHGIEKFEKNEFDLVFTDLGMPGMSGWQVAKKIKRINEKVPVALITGWNIELKEESKENGVDLIVHKPFQMNQVLRLVQEGMMLRDKFKTQNLQ